MLEYYSGVASRELLEYGIPFYFEVLLRVLRVLVVTTSTKLLVHHINCTPKVTTLE